MLESLGYREFGRAVKLLRPEVPVYCVEDPGLYKQASEAEEAFLEERVSPLQIEKYNELVSDPDALSQKEKFDFDRKAGELAVEQLREEFGSMPINIQRDRPMLDDLMTHWEKVGFDRAAILNAGGKHIDRIKQMLPSNIRFIVIQQP